MGGTPCPAAAASAHTTLPYPDQAPSPPQATPPAPTRLPSLPFTSSASSCVLFAADLVDSVPYSAFGALGKVWSRYE